MKLNTKLTVYFALSKLLIIGFFILILPMIFNWYSIYTIDRFLKIQRDKVFDNIKSNGLNYYLEGTDSYGSYTMLKEDYVAIQRINANDYIQKAEINDEMRMIDTDTIEYRILRNVFTEKGNYYLLEIGRSHATIDLYSSLLQHVALVLLICLFIITIIFDYLYLGYLLKPFLRIIQKRLIEQQFPFNLNFIPIKTSTKDFKLLDSTLCYLMEKVTLAFNREKEFTANASHELLTPISILRSKIENMMLDEALSDVYIDKLGEMMKTLDRLNKIVKSLLFLARIDSGQFAKTSTVQIKQVIQDIAHEIAPLTEEKEIALSIHIKRDEKMPSLNEELIFHLFFNLINNAIRYNKTGGHIYVEDKNTNGKYWVTIRDTGDGLQEKNIRKLFNRFTHNGEAGSHGLGLAIVKSIADYFGILIKVDTQKNMGTAIALGFPLPQA